MRGRLVTAALLAALLLALVAGCRKPPVEARNTLDEAQVVFVVDECWNEGFNAGVLRTDDGRVVIECTAP